MRSSRSSGTRGRPSAERANGFRGVMLVMACGLLKIIVSTLTRGAQFVHAQTRRTSILRARCPNQLRVAYRRAQNGGRFRVERRILEGPRARAALLRGMDRMVSMLRSTLVPLPRTVAIARLAGHQAAELLDSAGTIARRTLHLADPF